MAEDAEAEAQAEEEQTAKPPAWRWRAGLIVTAAFGGLWLMAVGLIHLPNIPALAAVLLLLPYAFTMWLAMRPLEAKAKPNREPKVGLSTRLVGALILFLLVYLPFTFISNKVIPYAPVVEYGLFALAIFVLYRIIVRSLGVAASVEALPPATHRTHRQVIGAIDDPHYQRTVVMNYNFVERGRGSRHLLARLQRALESAGIMGEDQDDVLAPLRPYIRTGMFGGGGGRNQRARNRRQQALADTLQRLSRRIEDAA